MAAGDGLDAVQAAVNAAPGGTGVVLDDPVDVRGVHFFGEIPVSRLADA